MRYAVVAAAVRADFDVNVRVGHPRFVTQVQGAVAVFTLEPGKAEIRL